MFEGSGPIAEMLARGRSLRPDAREALLSLLGTAVGKEGLSRLFQPGFPGVRTFVIQERAAPDRAVELTVVGIARSGAPVWTGERIFARGRDGSLELHHAHDDVDPAYRSRNIIVDCLRREIELLRALDCGPAPRITIDAEGPGRYLCALHGFTFADETEEGPPVRSQRPLDWHSDRELLLSKIEPFLRRYGQRQQASPSAIEALLAQALTATRPSQLAALRLGTSVAPPGPNSDPELGGVGRALLLADETPSWRGALYLPERDPEAAQQGERYRLEQTARSEARLARELAEAREQFAATNRTAKLRALQQLATIAPTWVLSDVKALVDNEDRKIAAVAKQVVRQITGADLSDRILAFAESPQAEGARRGLAYRVLAEYFPQKIADQVSMLRVNPDAHIQRAVLPCLWSDPEAGPELGAMLAANTWRDGPRPYLLELRMELIERLTLLADPRTLPVLTAALVETRPPAAAEIEALALSRALVAHPDPRARNALNAAAQSLEVQQIP